MKVLFHIDELHKWVLLVSNIMNIKKEDENIEVSVVVNGEAVKLLNQEHLELPSNVLYYACKNSLKAHDIPLKSVHQAMHIVPSGVYHIAQLEERGYHYIKP